MVQYPLTNAKTLCAGISSDGNNRPLRLHYTIRSTFLRLLGTNNFSNSLLPNLF